MARVYELRKRAMRYYIVSADGHRREVANFRELQENSGEALNEFIETGEADYALAEEIKEEIATAEMFADLKRIFDFEAPFVLREEDYDSV